MPKWTPLAYRPDQDTSWELASGSLTTCGGFIPTRRGTYANWKCDQPIHSYTSAVEPVAAGIVTRGSGIGELYIFNKQSIFSASGNPAVATDRSSTTYSSSTVGWDWTTFGDTVIATNYYNVPQKQTTLSGSFADLGGSPPKAQCIATFFGLIVLGNYDDGTATPDGWACSDLEDPEDWTITSTNFADKGRLYDTPGPIRSLVPLRDSLIAYKDDSIYVGEFVGDPSTTIIAWRLISDKVGCAGLHGVAVLNDCHYFAHRTGLYVFDGSAVRQIGQDVSNTLFDNLASAGIAFTQNQACIDARANSIFFGFAVNGSTKLDNWIVYNIETGRWGSNYDSTFTNASSSSSYPTCVVKCTLSDLIAYYSALAAVGNLTTAVLCGPNSTGKVSSYYTIYGVDGTVARGNELITGVIGNGDDNLKITRIKPRFFSFIAGATPQCVVYTSKDEGTIRNLSGTPVTFTWNSTELCFDGSASGRYVVIDMVIDNGCEIGGLWIDGWTKPAGKR